METNGLRGPPFNNRDGWDSPSHSTRPLDQHGRRLSRIQVKSCFSLEKRRYTGFPIIVASHWRGKQVGYTIEEIDFIAAYIARYDDWCLTPIE